MNPPKPTNLKLLQGNPGKRKINKNEPNPCSSIPVCPAHLDSTARTIWKRTGERLLAIGCITEIDEAMFALYCQLYSVWLRLVRDVKKEGLFIASPVMDKNGEPVLDKNGEPYTVQVKNPKQIEARLIATQLKTVSAEFGMSPSSRSRISVNVPGGEEGELEKWEKEKRNAG